MSSLVHMLKHGKSKLLVKNTPDSAHVEVSCVDRKWLSQRIIE